MSGMATPMRIEWSFSNSPEPAAVEFWQLAMGEPFHASRSWRIERSPSRESIAAAGRIVAWSGSAGSSCAVVEAGGAIAMFTWGRPDMTVSATASGPDEAPVAALLAALAAAHPAVEIDEGQVVADFWYLGPHGPQVVHRTLDVPSWDEISGNYAAPERAEIERVMRRWRPGDGGDMILWGGPPGTGKTFALRALAREWRAWCSFSYITDPDEFFGKAAYMIPALLQDGGGDVPQSYGGAPDPAPPKWRLIVLEDCGELLTADAKARVGAALGRLLNLTDGLIGQGLRVLVLITTNEEGGALHEAVVRPGRCASRVAFGRLGATDANAWRAARGLARGAGGATVAELYAEAAGRSRPAERTVGFA